MFNFNLDLTDINIDLNDFFSNYIAIGISLSILLIVILVGIFYYTNMNQREGLTSSSSNDSSSSSSSSENIVELLFFFTDWCPHCKTAKPEWEKVKTEYNGKEVNGKMLKFVDVNCTQETPEINELLKQYSVEGYPTIKAQHNGDITDYDAKPSEETLTEFIKQL
jgi:thiol-disulfide isomerase/thioredoxin